VLLREVVGTKKKTPEVLDSMVEHIRYELTRSMEFLMVGNAWCETLDQPFRRLAEQSILESGLIHLRCLIEFLGDAPKGDRVMARDYLPSWDWTISGNLLQVTHLHGRLAHLGVVRSSTEATTDGGYSWREWITTEAPTVLRAFRDFLVALSVSSPVRYGVFVQPDPYSEPIDLIATLNQLVGPK